MKHILALLGFCLLLTSKAWAGSISITSTTEMRTTVENQMVHLQGSVTLSNGGDENAMNVFPTLRAGVWAWSGDPHSVAKGAKESWKIDASIPLTELMCEVGSSCSKEDSGMAPRGVIPLLVRSHYSDLNGYKFTGPHVAPLYIGALTPADTVALQEPEVSATLSLSGNGQSFTGALRLFNNSNQDLQVLVSSFSSVELQTLDKPREVTVRSKTPEVVKLHIQNGTGTLGSAYPVFAIVQWKQDGLWHLSTPSDYLTIARKSYTMTILLGTAFFAVLVASVAASRRRRRKARSS
ncbi:MAG: hypothetical protein J0M12_03620 [Deltaproteobacteria bacterium]|nr:hypothetical protein [Deltaproteobacteria bacterium]